MVSDLLNFVFLICHFAFLDVQFIPELPYDLLRLFKVFECFVETGNVIIELVVFELLQVKLVFKGFQLVLNHYLKLFSLQIGFFKSIVFLAPLLLKLFGFNNQVKFVVFYLRILQLEFDLLNLDDTWYSFTL